MVIKNLIAPLILVMLFVVSVTGQGKIQGVRVRADLYERAISDAAERHKVDPRLLWTIAYLESRFRPEVISYKDGKPCAYGLMQFVAGTARRYGLRNPHNAADALDAAARYVRDLEERFGGRAELVLAAYNSGEGTVEAFRNGKRLVLSNGKVINPNAIRTDGIPPYDETREYVARGKSVYQEIAREGLFSDLISKISEGVRNEPTKRWNHSRNEQPEGSLYILGPIEQGREQDTKRKTTGSVPTRSLYAN